MELKSKMIVSGKMQEIMEFNYPIYKQENKILNPFGRKGSNSVMTEEEKQERQKHNREITLSRNRSSLKRIVYSNLNQYKEKDKFITLTFRKKPENITQADKQLKRFIRKLRKITKNKILYIGVRELQKENKRNAIHYHLCMFDMPYIKHRELLNIWCKGNPYMDIKKPSGVNIKGINKGLDQIIDYLTGYELKQLLEDADADWLKGHKTIIKSKGLIKPTIYDLPEYIRPEPEQIEKALSFIDNRITYYRMKNTA